MEYRTTKQLTILQFGQTLGGKKLGAKFLFLFFFFNSFFLTERTI